MGTVIDRVDCHARRLAQPSQCTSPRGHEPPSDCLDRAGRTAHDVDLLVNAGIYRDRNLGEPALAAMIQQDIGANPEDPHTTRTARSPSTSRTEPAGFSAHCRSSTVS